MSLVSPYKKLYQYTRVYLTPYNLNSDIKNNIMFTLKKQVEKKCNMNGYVENIYDIAEYTDGDIINEDFSGNVIFNIKYYCKICIPIIDTIIIAKIKLIKQNLIIANNGPLYIFISNNMIDESKWNINTNDIININTKNKLEPNNLVKIKINKTRIHNSSNKINVIGTLLDFASEKEINDFYTTIEKKEQVNNFDL
jgi:DNA-directed RNA polymerase subunit E'/Rpb7